MTDTDALDDLAHEIRNALTIVFLIAQKTGSEAAVINKQAKRMKDAWDKYEQVVRTCPYAGQGGAKCKQCNV